jgi:polysaccharide deacetylase 2 family uncharacterized protein YibQ
MSGWRWLGLFWLVVLAVLGVGGGVLQYLGPPRLNDSGSAASLPGAVAGLDPVSPPPGALAKAEVPPPGAGAGAGQPEALRPPTPDVKPTGDDRPKPMLAAAASFDRATSKPWVGLLLAGIGLNLTDSERAVKLLPGGVTLVVSPYAANLSQLLADARLAGHEYLVAIPMEPQGYPLNDPGNHALMTTLTAEQNRAALDWVLSRIDGYVGATSALGALRGERFTGMAGQMDPVLATLAERGLLYVASRADAPRPPYVWSRGIDLVVDEPAARTDIDAKLDRLERMAQDKGSAVGLVTAVRPVTVDRIAAWASGLSGRGVALAPVSALVEPPIGKETAGQ